MESTLSNPLILSSMFKNLDVFTLKICRQVSKTWEMIATPLFHRNSRLFIVEPSYSRPISVRSKNMDLLAEIENGKIPSGWYNYRLSGIKPLEELSKLLDKIKDRVKSLLLEISYDVLKHSFTPVQAIPTLQSLKIDYDKQRDTIEGRLKVKEDALWFSQIINQSSNIRKLKINQSKFSPFFETLFGPEGLGGNDKFKKSLQSLTISTTRGAIKMKAENFRFLQNLQLELKYLNLRFLSSDTDTASAVHALFLWFQDLSPYLEYLYMNTTSFKHDPPLFLSQMNKLKSLTIDYKYSSCGEGIIPLLNQLPVLEKLVLHKVNFSVGRRTQFESYDGPGFPCLREFEITLNNGTFEDSYCSPHFYVPQLFPNLKQLSYEIFTKFELLSCIHGLKETMIEELGLSLFYAWNTSTARMADEPAAQNKKAIEIPPWGLESPSFNNWEKLRQLKLNGFFGGISQRFCINLEKLLPRSLTSLQLSEREPYQTMDVSFLTKLLQGLPLLMELKLDETTILEQGTDRIKRSQLINIIRKDPFINPYLHISNR